MLIKDLPEKLKSMALAQPGFSTGPPTKEMEISRAFSWKDSKQGYNFWANVCKGVFPDEYKDEYKEEINNTYSIW